MKSVALKLALAEDASEGTISPRLVKLAEHDAAETERANAARPRSSRPVTKAASMAAFTAALDEKIGAHTIATGERGFYVKMAEEHLALAEKAIAQRTVKVIDLSEKGSDSEGAGSEMPHLLVESAEKSRIRAAKDGSTFDAASKLVLAESPSSRRATWSGARTPETGPSMATKLPVGPFRDETFVTSETFASLQFHAVLIGSNTGPGRSWRRQRALHRHRAEQGGLGGAQLVARTDGQSFAMVDGTTNIAINDPLDVDASGHLVRQELPTRAGSWLRPRRRHQRDPRPHRDRHPSARPKTSEKAR